MKEHIQELIESKNLNIADYADSWDLYEALDYDGSLHELIDSQIDIYYYDLRKWAVDNYHFIEEAYSEGLCETGQGGEFDYHKFIQAGQYVAYRDEAFNLVEEIFNEFTSEVV